MADSSPLDDPLALCALLRWFDDQMLAALLSLDKQTIDRLLASAEVVPAPDRAGAFVLRDDVHARELVRLRITRPLDEMAFHIKAFEYFLSQMAQADAPDRTEAETCCFHHLARLFVLLFLRLRRLSREHRLKHPHPCWSDQ